MLKTQRMRSNICPKPQIIIVLENDPHELQVIKMKRFQSFERKSRVMAVIKIIKDQFLYIYGTRG